MIDDISLLLFLFLVLDLPLHNLSARFYQIRNEAKFRVSVDEIKEVALALSTRSNLKRPDSSKSSEHLIIKRSGGPYTYDQFKRNISNKLSEKESEALYYLVVQSSHPPVRLFLADGLLCFSRQRFQVTSVDELLRWDELIGTSIAGQDLLNFLCMPYRRTICVPNQYVNYEHTDEALENSSVLVSECMAMASDLLKCLPRYSCSLDVYSTLADINLNLSVQSHSVKNLHYEESRNESSAVYAHILYKLRLNQVVFSFYENLLTLLARINPDATLKEHLILEQLHRFIDPENKCSSIKDRMAHQLVYGYGGICLPKLLMYTEHAYGVNYMRGSDHTDSENTLPPSEYRYFITDMRTCDIHWPSIFKKYFPSQKNYAQRITNRAIIAKLNSLFGLGSRTHDGLLYTPIPIITNFDYNGKQIFMLNMSVPDEMIDIRSIEIRDQLIERVKTSEKKLDPSTLFVLSDLHARCKSLVKGLVPDFKSAFLNLTSILDQSSDLLDGAKYASAIELFVKSNANEDDFFIKQDRIMALIFKKSTIALQDIAFEELKSHVKEACKKKSSVDAKQSTPKGLVNSAKIAIEDVTEDDSSQKACVSGLRGFFNNF